MRYSYKNIIAQHKQFLQTYNISYTAHDEATWLKTPLKSLRKIFLQTKRNALIQQSKNTV